ncbi:MAG: class I SAM-dependent methyltransferase [Lactobacillales bacterium]|jgi:site-specific DNA-methyltransferase (adenine-specific)|nr:class I SAM-dependent methyltransferase [Lactobacillales bacterium]
MDFEELLEIFNLHFNGIKFLQEARGTSFYEAFVEHFNIENFEDLEPHLADHLERIHLSLKEYCIPDEAQRVVLQMLILKGGMDDHVQPNHQLTPDGIGIVASYVVNVLYGLEDGQDFKAIPFDLDPDKLYAIDLASGTNNLLITLAQSLKQDEVNLTGVEIDETMAQIGKIFFDTTHSIGTFDQADSIQLLMDDANQDVAISDLPVGYYPLDMVSSLYKIGALNEHTYAHHLLIEQTMNMLRPGAFGLFLVPTNFLETPQSTYLKDWLEDTAYLQAVVGFPSNLFSSKDATKSLIVLQKKGKNVAQASEVYTIQLNQIKEPAEVRRFIDSFYQWAKENYAQIKE